MTNMASNYSQLRHAAVMIFCSCAWLLSSSVFPTSISDNYLSAHDEFKDPMEQRYKLKSISCKACHTDNKDKAIRNAFGKLLHAELKAKEVTKGLEAAKLEGEAAEKKYEKQMVKEFLIALEAVEKKKLTFAALLQAGLLNGVRLDSAQVNTDELTVTLIGNNATVTSQPAADKPAEAAPPDAPKSEPATTPTATPVPSKPAETAPVIEGEIRNVPPDDAKPAKPAADPAPSTEASPVPPATQPPTPAEPNADAQP